QPRTCPAGESSGAWRDGSPAIMSFRSGNQPSHSPDGPNALRCWKEPPVKNSNLVLIDRHPGRSTQSIGMARELGTDPELSHEPSGGVVGTKGDSQCYLGVSSKLEAIHARLRSRIGKGPGQLKLRLVQPEFTIATS